MRASGIRKDPYYTDPQSGIVFRTKKDVLHYLETGELSKYCYRKKGRHPGDSQRIEVLKTRTNESLVTSSVGNAMEVVQLLVDETSCQNLQLALPQGIENTSTDIYMLMGADQLEGNPSEAVNVYNSKVTCTQSYLLDLLPQVRETKKQTELVPVLSIEASSVKQLDAVDTDKPDLESKEPASSITEIKKRNTPNLKSKQPELFISRGKEVDHGANNYPPVDGKFMVYKSSKKLAVMKSSSIRPAYIKEELHANPMQKALKPLEKACPVDALKPEVVDRTLEPGKTSAHSCLLPGSSFLRSEEPTKALASTCLAPVAAGEPVKLEKLPASPCLLPQTLIKQLGSLGNLSKSPEPLKPTVSTGKTPYNSSMSNETAKAVPSVGAPSQSPSRLPGLMESRASVGLPMESLFRSLIPMKVATSCANKLPECSFKTQKHVKIATASTDKMLQASSNIIKPVKMAATSDNEQVEMSSATVEFVSTTHELPHTSCLLMEPLKQGPHAPVDTTGAPCKIPEAVKKVVHSCKGQSRFSCNSPGLFDKSPLLISFELPLKATPASPASDKLPLPPLIPFDFVGKLISELKKAKEAEPEDLLCKLVEKPSEVRASTNIVASGRGPSRCFDTRRGTNSGRARVRDWKKVAPAILSDSKLQLFEPDVTSGLDDEKPLREMVEVLDKVRHGRDGQAAEGSRRRRDRKKVPQVILLECMKQKKPDVSKVNLSESEDESCEILEEKPPTQVLSKASSGINQWSLGGFVARRVRGRKSMAPVIVFDSCKQKKHNIQTVNKSELEDVSYELVGVKPTNETANTQDRVHGSSAHGIHGGSRGSGGSGSGRGNFEKRENPTLQISMHSVKTETDTGVRSGHNLGSGGGRGRGHANNQLRETTPTTPSDKSTDKVQTPAKISSSRGTRGGSSSSRRKKARPRMRMSMRLAGIDPSIIISGTGSPPILRRSTRLN